MTPEMEQYACDLINWSSDRTDSAVPVCKLGNLCNGKCIPKNHQCKTGLSLRNPLGKAGQSIANGVVGSTALGLAAVGANQARKKLQSSTPAVEPAPATTSPKETSTSSRNERIKKKLAAGAIALAAGAIGPAIVGLSIHHAGKQLAKKEERDRKRRIASWEEED